MSSAPRATVALRPPPHAPDREFDSAPDREFGSDSFGHLEVLGAIAALSFVAARFAPVLELFPACPFKALLGVPCATCGMTRAFVSLAHGDVSAALAASPLGALAAAAAWAFALATVVRPLLRLRWPSPTPATARAVALLGLAALVANWGWMLATGSSRP